jgi:hypothetical protein
MPQGRNRLAIAAVLVAVATAPALWAQTPRDPADWVPADAQVYLGVTSIDETIAAYEKTAQYAMSQDPAAKDLPGANFMAVAIDRFKKRLAGLLDTTPDQLKLPFKGGAAIYVRVPPGGTSEDVAFVLLAAVDDRAVTEEYYGKIVRQLGEAADARDTDSFQSHRIDIFRHTPPADGEGDTADFDELAELDESDSEAVGAAVDTMLDEFFTADNLPETLATCLTDELFVAATSPDEIKRVLRRATGDQVLSGHADYRQLTQLYPEAGTVRFLINVPAMLEQAAREGGPEAHRSQRALGLTDFGSIVGHLRIGAGKYDSEADAVLLLRGERSGLARIFSMANGPVLPPGYIAASASAYFALHINAGELIDEIEKIVRQFDAAAADEMREALEAAPSPTGEGTMNLRRDLIAHLRPPLTYSMGFTRPYGPSSAHVLLTLAHRSREAIQQLVGTTGLTAREFRGAELYDVPVGPGIALGVTAEQVLAGSVGYVEGAVTVADEGLAGAGEMRRAAAAVADEAWLTVFIDARQIVEAAIGLAEKRADIESTAFMNPSAMIAMGVMQSTLGEQVDEQALAAHRQLLRYQAPIILTVRSASDGVHLRAVVLKPAE